MSLPAFTQVGGDAGTEIQAIATEAMEPGMVYAWGPWFIFVDGNQAFAIGALFNGKDNLNLRSRRTASAFTSAAVAVGDDIYVETTTGLPKTAAGANIIGPIGKCTRAKASGVDYVEFRLNGRGTGSPWIPAATQEALTTAGAISVANFLTTVNTTTGSGHADTLADGVRVGQLKKILLIVDAGDLVVTPANLSGGTTITFADAGDFALLQWNGSDWVAVELGNTVDGISGPVVA